MSRHSQTRGGVDEAVNVGRGGERVVAGEVVSAGSNAAGTCHLGDSAENACPDGVRAGAALVRAVAPTVAAVVSLAVVDALAGGVQKRAGATTIVVIRAIPIA